MTPSSPSAYRDEQRREGARRVAPWPGWAPYLATIPLFAGLSRRQLRSLARLADLRWYADGRTLVRAGSPGDAFFADLQGTRASCARPPATRACCRRTTSSASSRSSTGHRGRPRSPPPAA